MITISDTHTAQKNKLVGANPFLWVLELHPSAAEVVYLVNDNKVHTIGGIDYLPFPFSIDAQEKDGTGNLGTCSISIANTDNFFGHMLERSRGFSGENVIMRIINSGSVVLSQSFRVQTVSVGRSAASFTVGNEDLLKVGFPSQKYFRNRCRRQYKGTLCGYAGALATCDRTLRSTNGCEAHSNSSRGGMFPGIPKA
jgi:phage-related protein